MSSTIDISDTTAAREVLLPTFRPLTDGSNFTNQPYGETRYDRRIVGQKPITQNVPVYETTETFTGRVEVPVECHVNIRRPTGGTVESVRRIERDFPLIEEEPEEVLQPTVYNDKIVEVPTTITVVKPVYKKEIRELIREVPKIIEKTVDRLVEIPDVQYVYRFANGPTVPPEVEVPTAQPVVVESSPFSTPARPEVIHEVAYPPPCAEVAYRHQPASPVVPPMHMQPPAHHSEVYHDCIPPPYFYHPETTQFVDYSVPPPAFNGGYPPAYHSYPGYSECFPPDAPAHWGPSPMGGGYFPFPVATTSAVDIDVPVPVPVPVYMDYPVEVPIDVPTPTPVVVGHRYHPVYKQSKEVKPVEVFVPKPQFTRAPSGMKPNVQRGRLRVTGVRTLHDNAFHPYPNARDIEYPLLQQPGAPPYGDGMFTGTNRFPVSRPPSRHERHRSTASSRYGPLPPPYPLPAWT